MRRLLPAALLILSAAAACKRKPPACNAVPNDALAIPFSAETTPPQLAGGGIADGVYHATRAQGFNDAPAAGQRMTLAVSNHGHTFAWSGDVLDAAGKRVTGTVSATANVSVSGTWLAVTTTCPAEGPSPLPGTMVFSATPTTLILAARDDQGTVTSVTTYTRAGAPSGLPAGFVHPPIPPSSR